MPVLMTAIALIDRGNREKVKSYVHKKITQLADETTSSSAEVLCVANDAEIGDGSGHTTISSSLSVSLPVLELEECENKIAGPSCSDWSERREELSIEKQMNHTTSEVSSAKPSSNFETPKFLRRERSNYIHQHRQIQLNNSLEVTAAQGEQITRNNTNNNSMDRQNEVALRGAMRLPSLPVVKTDSRDPNEKRKGEDGGGGSILQRLASESSILFSGGHARSIVGNNWRYLASLKSEKSFNHRTKKKLQEIQRRQNPIGRQQREEEERQPIDNLPENLEIRKIVVSALTTEAKRTIMRKPKRLVSMIESLSNEESVRSSLSFSTADGAPSLMR